MNVDAEVWLEPEEALTRFKRPDLASLDFENVTQKTSQSRYGFKVGDIGFLIPRKTMSEVMKSFKVFPVPNTQLWFQGLTNLRGNLVPVFDLALLLGITDTPTTSNNLLILEKGAESIGVLIDSMPRSQDISSYHPLQKSPQLPAALNEYITEVYTFKDFLWVSIDHKEFFKSVKSNIAL